MIIPLPLGERADTKCRVRGGRWIWVGLDISMKNVIWILVLPIVISFSAGARDSDDPDVPWDKLRDTAKRYLDTCCAPKVVQGMTKKLKQRVEQRMQDNDSVSEDTCMRSFMLDW